MTVQSHNGGKIMKFTISLPRSFLHAIATLVAILLVWAVRNGWYVFVLGNHSPQWGGPWGVYSFGMYIALTIGLILCGVFLIMSLFYHLNSKSIPTRQYLLSSLTLAFTSLTLLLVLPQGGIPLIALLIILPAIATFWMLGSLVRPA
jgi:hypothetical protein